MPATPAARQRPNLVTLVCVSVVAWSSADMVHEALRHGVASWLVGDRILSLSTVALENAESNRLVSACGTLANLAAGAIALLALRRVEPWTASAYFLWLFGAFNLCNTGYLIFSAVSDSGDWAAVIAGLEPPPLWRTILRWRAWPSMDGGFAGPHARCVGSSSAGTSGLRICGVSSFPPTSPRESS